MARFHLGNGARLERLDWLADTSPKGLSQSHGFMVNYLYDPDEIEKNHEAYAERRDVVASNAVKRLARVRARGRAGRVKAAPASVSDMVKE